eukprot:TRINITY_DN13076_c0_g1_i1.p1 TRINITY_DN13076_c0_g1~~TRINITY_DN13076_c0_g1_i1.p1  ORF type:complete len:685 (-),score=146.35 TRINITY_DN13076_c0_g1_i1:242-2296(-)
MEAADRLKSEGNAKLKAGNPSEARALYEKALTVLPSSKEPAAASLGASLNLNASLACLRLEAWEDAEGFATKSLKLNPKSSKAFYRRGLARTRLAGIEADARRDFECALEIEPKGEGAQLVLLELQRLKSKDQNGTGFAPPPGADSSLAQRFEALNDAREQQGACKISWSEWESMEKQVAKAAASASAWRKRVDEASKCSREEQVSSSDSRSLLTQCLDELIKVPAAQRSAPAKEELLLSETVQQGTVDLGYYIGSGDSGVRFLAPGPWLFDGASSHDVPFEVSANPGGAFTVDLWAACNGTVGHQCLLASRDQLSDGSGKAGYMFYVEPEGVWSFWVGVGTHWAKLYGTKVELGKWTLLRGTVDPNAREASFYVDLRLAASQSWVDFLPNTKQPLRLGAGRSECTAHFFFHGDLRDLCVLGRCVPDQDLAEEIADACSKHAQEDSDRISALQQLPKLLGQGKGGLASGGSALSAALQWCSAASTAPFSGLSQRLRFQAPEDQFRKASLKLLESGNSATSGADGMRALFLTFNLQAVLQPDGEDLLRLSFAPGCSQQFWAFVMQSGHYYKILYEVNGVCSLADALMRQRKLRPQLDGWVTQKDAAMWLAAFNSLAFSLDAAEVGDAVLNVFHFAYWATQFFSPEVRVEHFQPTRSSRVQAALVEGVPPAALEKVIRELTAEAAK